MERLSYLLYRTLRGMATRAATQTARLAPSFVLGLPSLCSFAQAAAVSQAQRALSCFILCLLFSSVVCRVLCRPLCQHNSAISTTPRSFTSRTRWLHINYPIEKCGCETAENYIFHDVDIVIQQIRCIYGTMYGYIHKYRHRLHSTR